MRECESEWYGYLGFVLGMAHGVAYGFALGLTFQRVR